MTVRDTATRATISDLKPNTRYKVDVTAVGTEGSSIPTAAAIFLTYSETGE